MPSAQEELVFAPLGGLGEIGMNMALYGFGAPGKRKYILVDCGVAFADTDMPGVDLILPDPVFIEKNRKDLLGLVITHAHEDHVGAVAALWPRLACPVYATAFAAGLSADPPPRRAGRAENSAANRAAGRTAATRALRHRIRADVAFDSRSQPAGDPHARRHRGAFRRLEARRKSGPRACPPTSRA